MAKYTKFETKIFQISEFQHTHTSDPRDKYFALRKLNDDVKIYPLILKQITAFITHNLTKKNPTIPFQTPT